MRELKEDTRKLVFKVLKGNKGVPDLENVKLTSIIIKDLTADAINLDELSDAIYDKYLVLIDSDEYTLDMTVEKLAELIFKKISLSCNNA